MPNVNDYLDKARRGDVSAQKQLAMHLIRSQNTVNDGVEWLKKAAETDADAMYLLGKLYLKKLNDAKQAFTWYEKAAQRDHVDAMIDTATFYLFGYQTEQNTGKAIEWYKRATRFDSPVAYHNLGFLCYQDSELYSTAISFFTKAADLGYADSAYMLGVMYLQGKGAPKDAKAALEKLTLSHNLGKHFACRPIGDLYFQGAFDNGKQNPDKALEWYMRGMEHDVLSCIEVLGDCYFNGFGVDKDLDLAYDFYKTAAEKGSTDAAFALGLMYIGGEAVKKNHGEALKWMLVAEKKGHKKAPQFVQMLTDVLSSRGSGAAAASVTNGGNVGFKLRSSYSSGAEAVISEQKARYEANKKKHAGIYAAAGAMSGNGSYTDYELGAVISDDGEVSYVNTDLGIILGADGSVSSHDANTGLTYNWSTGSSMVYNEDFHATMNLDTGDVSYNFNGYTIS